MIVEPIRPHVAGPVQAHGSQFCRRCGMCLRAPADDYVTVEPGDLVVNATPCAFPIGSGDGRKVDSPSGE